MLPGVAATRRPFGSPAGCSSREGRKVEAALQKCLANVDYPWAVTIKPSGCLAHWWVIELRRADDGSPRKLFVPGARDVERELCRRIGEVVPEACCSGTRTCSPVAAGEKRLEIEIEASVPQARRECFEAGLARALERRSGAYRVRVAVGRKQDEIVVFLNASRKSTPLPLFFPGAPALGPEDVCRIVGNVLEGMGPGFK